MTSPITVTDEYVNDAGVTLTFTNVEVAIDLRSEEAGVTPTLINKGSIVVSSDQWGFSTTGIDANNAGSYVPCLVWNQVGADFSVSETSIHGSAVGFFFLFAGCQLLNDATFTVESGDIALGGNAPDGATVTNNGHFLVNGGSSALGLQLSGSFLNTGLFSVSSDEDAQGVNFFTWAGSFNNSGRVLVSGNSRYVRGMSFEGSADFSNSGKIIVHNSGHQDSVGVFLRNASLHSFENSGLIKADTVIEVQYKAPLGIHVHNTGKMIGDVHLIGTANSILNEGQMSGQIELGGGDDSYSGAHGVLKGAVFGGLGADTLTGGKLSELIYGDDGHDVAGDKADVISGGGGADTLVGGQGGDQLTGGAGADVFIYSSLADSAVAAPDLILGLANADRIDLSAIDANSTLAGDQAFTLVGHLSGHAGQAALIYDAAAHQTQLLFDVNGDGVADAEVLIKGDHTGFDNFVL